MRLAPFIFILLVFYIAIGIFDNSVILTEEGYQAYATNSSWPIAQMVFQPYYWNTTQLILMFFSIIGVSAGIILGASIFTKSDITILFVTFTAICSIGALPIISIYNFLSRNIAAFAGCTLGSVCPQSNLIAGLFAGGLAIYWIFTCVGWWAWRETT